MKLSRILFRTAVRAGGDPISAYLAVHANLGPRLRGGDGAMTYLPAIGAVVSAAASFAASFCASLAAAFL